MPEPSFDPEFDDEVREYESVIRSALRDAGGTDVLMRAEADPAVRSREIEPLLSGLGVLELVPTESDDQLQAAVAACRAAGAHALPYPVAARLAGNALGRGDGPAALAPVDLGAEVDGRARVDHADLPLDWHAVDVRAGTVGAVRVDRGTGDRLGRFLSEVAVVDRVAAPSPSVPLTLLLPTFTLLGMLEGALDLTREHVNDREQFGAALVSFQAVQHQLADALIVLELFEQQARYALWSFAQQRKGVLADVVGARLAGLRAADTVLRAGHQLHGATGLADESAISWFSRYAQPLRRLPHGAAHAGAWFTELVQHDGFDGLFAAAPSRGPSVGRVDDGPRAGRAADGGRTDLPGARGQDADLVRTPATAGRIS